MAQGTITWCIQRFVVISNFILCLGVALFAVGVYVVSDPWEIRPIVNQTGTGSIFAAGWTAVFTGLAFLLLGIFGMVAAFNYSRVLLLIYIICAIVVFIFEMTSCILAVTHRDHHSCCGVNGPEDWISYTSTYKNQLHSGDEFPWPRQCCRETNEGNIPGSAEACNRGDQNSVKTQVNILPCHSPAYYTHDMKHRALSI
uniref:Uroplakin 1a n=1 Tax=Eptatretus burgeri TaxID=7764 RepID=A0A8C4WZN8_EPTBU